MECIAAGLQVYALSAARPNVRFCSLADVCPVWLSAELVHPLEVCELNGGQLGHAIIGVLQLPEQVKHIKLSR